MLIRPNAITDSLTSEAESTTRLGNPSEDYGAHKRRMNAMATMTGMRGFSVPPLEPKTDAQGLTRGDRKRKADATARAKVSETREPQFMHSAARRQLEAA